LAVKRTQSNDFERLKLLWEKRSDHGAAKDFPIGPGDVLEISVPAMPELPLVWRVSGEGEIELPYIGEVKNCRHDRRGAGGGVTQVAWKIYAHSQGVSVFLVVKEYPSRQVAVLGSVLKPGMYTLNSESDTLYDLFTRAGGVTTDADPVVQIIPAEEVSEEDKQEVMAVASKLPKAQEKDPAMLIRSF